MVKEGDSVSLFCNVIGNLEFLFFWIIDGFNFNKIVYCRVSLLLNGR